MQRFVLMNTAETLLLLHVVCNLQVLLLQQEHSRQH
jgi:hypothetical protein